MRDNGGGWPEVVEELFSYLIDEPTVFNIESHTITSKIPYKKHYQYGFWDQIDMNISLKLKKKNDIYEVKNRLATTITPKENSFLGDLVVLTNPNSFSASSDFIGMLKSSNIGTTIGQTPGGNPHQVTAWIMPTLQLPNTKIKVVIPIVKSKSSLSFKENLFGMQPDIIIQNTFHDASSGKDAAMQFALEYLSLHNAK